MLLAQLALVNIFRFILKLEGIVFQLNVMQQEDFFSISMLLRSMPYASTKGPK